MIKVDVAGLKIDPITKPDLLNQVLLRIKNNQKTFISTPYSEFLYQQLSDKTILEFLNKADFAVPDGIGVFWAKRFLEIPLTVTNYWLRILQALWQIQYSLAAIVFNRRWILSAFPEKLPGSELIWDLAKFAAENNLSIYLLGGFENTPGLVAKALISKFPNILISGYSNKNADDVSIADDINRIQPDLLFVAYGPIKQEKWIAENLQKLNVKVAVGVGGSFDYIAGKRLSPPKFIRSVGLEWLWRLFTQPRRVKRIWQATFGLINKLWHYKVFQNLPLRKNVAVIILNKQNQVLVCQRNPNDFQVDIISSSKILRDSASYWQFPQGGVDAKENLERAAEREVREETGLINLQMVASSKKTNTYFWNNAQRKFWKNYNYQYSGQIQNVFYFEYLGSNADVKIDNHEFVNYRWIEIEEIKKVVHQERLGLIEIVCSDLKEMREKAIIN